MESQIRESLDNLQIWFASRCYGWRENATAEQLQQWADREREEEYLLSRLESLKAQN